MVEQREQRVRTCKGGTGESRDLPKEISLRALWRGRERERTNEINGEDEICNWVDRICVRDTGDEGIEKKVSERKIGMTKQRSYKMENSSRSGRKISDEIFAVINGMVY
jgi:hypothetical protein